MVLDAIQVIYGLSQSPPEKHPVAHMGVWGPNIPGWMSGAQGEERCNQQLTNRLTLLTLKGCQ